MTSVTHNYCTVTHTLEYSIAENASHITTERGHRVVTCDQHNTYTHIPTRVIGGWRTHGGCRLVNRVPARISMTSVIHTTARTLQRSTYGAIAVIYVLDWRPSDIEPGHSLDIHDVAYITHTKISLGAVFRITRLTSCLAFLCSWPLGQH